MPIGYFLMIAPGSSCFGTGLWCESTAAVNHVREYIQRTTGEDFRSWRTGLRIREAEQLLVKDPRQSISCVAAIAGFNDRSYFYRCFQKVTGRTVREYLETIN